MQTEPSDSVFPTTKLERLGHGLLCIVLLPWYGCLFLACCFVEIPQGHLVAATVRFLLQEIALALVIYSVFGLIWCVFMPQWLKRLGASIRTKTMRSFLLFTAAGSLTFAVIAIRRFAL